MNKGKSKKSWEESREGLDERRGKEEKGKGRERRLVEAGSLVKRRTWRGETLKDGHS